MAQLSDTRPEVAAVQLELLRRATTAERARRMRSLSRTVIELSRRALSETMPDATEREVALRWIALHYDAGLAAKVAGRLDAIMPERP